MRFQRVPGQMADEVPEGLMRFWRVPGQKADEVPDGSGADSAQGSGEFRCRWLMRFRRVPGQIAKNLPRYSKLLGITHGFIQKRTFLQDFPKKRNAQAQKPRFYARLSAKMELRSSKRSVSARPPSRMKVRNSKTKLFCETYCKNDCRRPAMLFYRLSGGCLVLRLPRKSSAEACDLQVPCDLRVRDVKFPQIAAVALRRVVNAHKLGWRRKAWRSQHGPWRAIWEASTASKTPLAQATAKGFAEYVADFHWVN